MKGSWLMSGKRWGVLSLAAVLPGCSALNPSFVDLIDPSGGSNSVENAPGYVAIVFVNNADVDERLLTYLETDLPDGGGVELTPYERRTLKPRLRFRVRVEFTNGNSNVFEFVDGSVKLVDSRFDASTEPDLIENDLTNAIVVCDVVRVSVDGPITVFMPAQIEGWQTVQNTFGGLAFQFVQFRQESLRFIPLEIDVLDEDGNVTLQRNIGVRDVPVPVEAPRCGSVVSITITGTLASPFINIADDPNNPNDQAFSRDVPSVMLNDANSIARIGGRFQIRVQVN